MKEQGRLGDGDALFLAFHACWSPQLELRLSFVREGDTVVCHLMDRLGRNLDDLRKLVLWLTARGVQLRSLKESLTFTRDDPPMANLLWGVMGAIAEFERQLIC